MFELALSAALIAGLGGGVHCAGMCGGIVRVLCVAPDGASRWRYMLAYNAGRVASYACAGALAGALGEAGLLTRAAPQLQPWFFLLASVMLVVLGIYLAGATRVMAGFEAAGAWLWRRIQPWTRAVLPVNSLARAFGFGALWGWLPCGMVYAVLLTALALANAAQGAAVMLAFGLGTLPNLAGISLLWQRTERASSLRVLAGCFVVVLGVYGLLKITQPGAMAGNGLLCTVFPGLATLLP